MHRGCGRAVVDDVALSSSQRGCCEKDPCLTQSQFESHELQD